MIQEEKKNNILQWTVAGLINCHCAYCLQGRVLSPAAGAGIVPAAGAGIVPSSRGVGVLLITGAGGEQVVMGRLGSDGGAAAATTAASQSRAGRRGGHTRHACCRPVHVSHVCM